MKLNLPTSKPEEARDESVFVHGIGGILPDATEQIQNRVDFPNDAYADASISYRLAILAKRGVSLAGAGIGRNLGGPGAGQVAEEGAAQGKTGRAQQLGCQCQTRGTGELAQALIKFLRQGIL